MFDRFVSGSAMQKARVVACDLATDSDSGQVCRIRDRSGFVEREKRGWGGGGQREKKQTSNNVTYMQSHTPFFL